MALTIATMIAGKVTNTVSLGMVWMAVLMAVTWLKATLILNYYLDLKSATGGWNKGFIILAGMILLFVFAIYAGYAIYAG